MLSDGNFCWFQWCARIGEPTRVAFSLSLIAVSKINPADVRVSLGLCRTTLLLFVLSEHALALQNRLCDPI